MAVPFADSQRGNAVTARRWRGVLEGLGHRIVDDGDVLLALHARHSHAAIKTFRVAKPHAPIILALTGTDLYGDIRDNAEAQLSLKLADRFVLLQKRGLLELTPEMRERSHVILQSCSPPADPPPRDPQHFVACILGHLRAVKDPLLAAQAAKLLPADTPVRIRHYGAVIDADLGEQAAAANHDGTPYAWLGEISRDGGLRVIASAHVLLLTSLSEGGANTVTEAIACGTPVISTRIDGSIGLLGEDYPGYFERRDARGLADLLQHAATDAAFYADLKARVQALAPLVDPAHEAASWHALLAGLNV